MREQIRKFRAGHRDAGAMTVRTGLLMGMCMVAIAACGGGAEPPRIVDESGDPWRVSGRHCVRESEEGPVRRVINRTDPELCGLYVKHRPPDYVRVIPPPGMSSR